MQMENGDLKNLDEEAFILPMKFNFQCIHISKIQIKTGQKNKFNFELMAKRTGC